MEQLLIKRAERGGRSLSVFLLDLWDGAAIPLADGMRGNKAAHIGEGIDPRTDANDRTGVEYSVAANLYTVPQHGAQLSQSRGMDSFADADAYR